MSSLILTLVISLAGCAQVDGEQPAATIEQPATAVEGTPDAYLPPPEQREPVQRKEKSYQEYRVELKKWFVQEATAEQPAERMEAIVGLCALYHELRTDPRYPLSDALQQYKIKIWSRLSRVKKDLERELEDRAESQADDDTLAEMSDVDLLTSPADHSQLDARGGGPQRGDFGDDLVELIEKTIAPTKWDVNGGPFTIVYYAPLHALVVRASSEVHGRVGGLLGGLRQAGN